MISITLNQKEISADLDLPSSKSESNRALIIQALANDEITLHNLSSARDTQTMIRLLQSREQVLDVIDAGTTMRFLTAYFSATGKNQILTGTPRMCKRPIGELVDALRNLGAEIDYWKQEGYPPLHIKHLTPIQGGKIHMKGNVSSQFITALLLIAPKLKGGLDIQLVGEIYSRPYIEMTLSMMEYFGVQSIVDWEHQLIKVNEAPYKASTYTIESDWSAASYWYSMAALSDKCTLTLKGLRDQSWQGDREIANIMKHFGVHTTFDETGAHLSKSEHHISPQPLEIDFKEIPDMAQTVAVLSAAMNIPVYMSGLESLRIKETDRIFALQTELKKFGVRMLESSESVFHIQGDFHPSSQPIHTYEDHRMAMAFAPLSFIQQELQIEDPAVVGKSYPEFWEHLDLIGAKTSISGK